MSKRLSIEERIGRHVDKSSGCWIWTGYSNEQGYGLMTIEKVPRLAHRVHWESVNGSIKKGLCICHICDTPSCVNIEHLFLGAPADNNRDRDEKGRHYSATQTHCKHGHLFDINNTYYCNTKRNGKQKSYRHCRACNRRRMAEWRTRNE